MNERVKKSVGSLGMLIVLAVASVFLFDSTVHSQAWTPPKGQASLTTAYQFIDVGDHLFSRDVISPAGINKGKRLDLGDIKSHSVQLSAEYGATRRLALNAMVPWVVDRYKGPFPENPATDDGLYRGGIQNFGFQARYMALVRPLVVTPFVGVSIPSHAYPSLGHTAIGADLNEFHLGLNFGKLLTFISPNLYTQGRYDFAYVQKHMDHPRTNRSNVDLSLGYFVTPTISVGTNLAYQHTYGGMDWLDISDSDTSGFMDHDRVAKANWLELGGSFAVDVTSSLNIFAGYARTMWGENTHEINNSWTFGTTWTLPTLMPILK